MSAIDSPASARLGWAPWAGAVLGTLLAMAWIGAMIDDRNAAQKELQSARYEFEEKQARATNLEAWIFRSCETTVPAAWESSVPGDVSPRFRSMGVQ